MPLTGAVSFLSVVAYLHDQASDWHTPLRLAEHGHSQLNKGNKAPRIRSSLVIHNDRAQAGGIRFRERPNHTRAENAARCL